MGAEECVEGDRCGDRGGEPEAEGSEANAGVRSQGVISGRAEADEAPGASSPVTTIWADLRTKARQEPKRFKTGVENNLE